MLMCVCAALYMHIMRICDCVRVSLYMYMIFGADLATETLWLRVRHKINIKATKRIRLEWQNFSTTL